MAQTGFTPVSLYYTITTATAPLAANLVNGELAINITDGNLYYKDNTGAVQIIASKNATSGSFVNLAYTGTLTGGTGIINIGSGQIYKDANGKVALGTTSTTGQNLTVTQNITGATSAYGVVSEGIIQSDVTGLAVLYDSFARTAASSFTLGTLIHFDAVQGTFGSGSAVTSQYGFLADSTLVGATNNYGFYSNIATGANRWNFYAGGTASNYFAGNTIFNLGIGLGSATSPSYGTSGQVMTSAGPGAVPTWSNASVGTVTSVSGTGSVNGITLTGTVTSSGNITLGGTLGSIANSQLLNSSVTFNGQTVALGASGTITANTTNALTIGTGLSGTSFNGSSAVTITIDSTVATLSGTQTLTNKRIDPRIVSTTSATTLSPSIATADLYIFTALAAGLTINAPTGSPVEGDKLIFRILDNGTSQTLSWNATYTVIGTTLPTATTPNKMTYVGCIYNAANTRWDVIAVTTQA